MSPDIAVINGPLTPGEIVQISQEAIRCAVAALEIILTTAQCCENKILELSEMNVKFLSGPVSR